MSSRIEALRRQYACAAMQGLLSHGADVVCPLPFSHLAKEAFDIADAMLQEERTRPPWRPPMPPARDR